MHGPTGKLRLAPAAPTVVPTHAKITVDQRNEDAVFRRMMRDAVGAATQRLRAARGCEARRELVWRIAPNRFEPGVEAETACVAVDACDRWRFSGAVHDAAGTALQRPTAMLSSPSRGGVSDTRDQDTDTMDPSVAIRSVAHLASQWPRVQQTLRLKQEVGRGRVPGRSRRANKWRSDHDI